MSNIIDYIKWRGDLTMEERSFCEADQLVFSQLAYVNWNGIVPEIEKEEDFPTSEITIQSACERYLRHSLPAKIGEEETQKEHYEFVKVLGESARFGQLTLFNFVDRLDVENPETDFSVISIRLTEDTIFVAYRGTLDSIVGWKEDFCMSYQVIPAQKFALDYLEKSGNENVKHMYVGGHSKGGNLALYASALCSEAVQDKIIQVYNNDGPGLCKEIIPDEKIDRIRDRLMRYVPEFSVFGALFETEQETVIVKSSESGIMQHTMSSWQMEGDGFVTSKKHSEDAIFMNNIFSRWIEQENMENRETFVNSFFDALKDNGITGLKAFEQSGVDDIMTILLSVTQSGEQTRGTVYRFLKTAVAAIGSVNFDSFLREKEVLEALGLFILGFAISLYPMQAIRLVGVVLGIAGTVALGKRLLDTAFEGTGSVESRKLKVIVQLAGICILMYLVAEKSILLKMSNLFIGIGFLIFAYRWLTRAFTYKKLFPKRAIALLIAAGSLVVGVVPLVSSAVEMKSYMISVGGLIWVYSIGKFVYLAYKNGKANKR